MRARAPANLSPKRSQPVDHVGSRQRVTCLPRASSTPTSHFPYGLASDCYANGSSTCSAIDEGVDAVESWPYVGTRAGESIVRLNETSFVQGRRDWRMQGYASLSVRSAAAKAGQTAIYTIQLHLPDVGAAEPRASTRPGVILGLVDRQCGRGHRLRMHLAMCCMLCFDDG